MRIKGNMSIDNKSVQKFWRFHPVTGEDANLFDTTQLSEDERAELAQMVRDGAKFYWEGGHNGPGTVQGYSRVEYSNVKFVLDMTGVKYEFLDTAKGR